VSAVRAPPSSPGAEAPRGRSRRRLAVLLAAPFAGLLLVELAVRVLDVRPLPVNEARGAIRERCEDAELGFENRGDGRKVARLDGGQGVVMRTNGQRFRGPEVALEKPPGVLRVACLGDSHTFGDGVGEGETWPDRLRELAAPGVEVLNCGVNAYDAHQSVLWFERRVAAFEPDVVVFAYFVNDAAARDVPAPSGHDRLAAWTHPHRGGWIGTARDLSQALDVACDAVYRWRSLDARASAWASRYVESDAGWQRARAALERLAASCREDDRRLVVALMPYVVRGEGGHFLSREALAVVREHCEGIGVEVYDGEPSIQVLGDDELRVSAADFHASAAAYRCFAAGLAGWLAERGLPFAGP